MEIKFNRNYQLSVQKQNGDTLTIMLPFTIEFDIQRNILSSANVCSIRIYNLNENNRNQIRKNLLDYTDLRLVELRAGYDRNLPIIFKGNISQAWSVREGSNFITTIECFDGGQAFANSLYAKTYPANTEIRSIFEDMISSLPGISVGKIGNYSGQISRGNAYNGSTASLLGELSGGGFFVDNMTGNILKNLSYDADRKTMVSEYLPGDILLIDSSTGLLGTPVLEQTYLNFDMLFEPRLILGQKVQLNSSTGYQGVNGEYKVISLNHRGMISDAVCGDAITSVGLLTGSLLLEAGTQ